MGELTEKIQNRYKAVSIFRVFWPKKVDLLNEKFEYIFIPRKAGYCNHLRVFVCLFVCLLAGFLINYWSDFDEIW